MAVPGASGHSHTARSRLASRRHHRADTPMAPSASILILERDAGAGRAQRDLCESNGARAATCVEPEQAIASLTGGQWDALLIAPQHVQAGSPEAGRVLRVARDHDVELVLGVPG